MTSPSNIALSAAGTESPSLTTCNKSVNTEDSAAINPEAIVNRTALLTAILGTDVSKYEAKI